MKKIFTLLLVLSSFKGFSQPQDVETLQETARSFMNTGDFENALLVLDKALKLKPNNLEITRDIVFLHYMKRDFAKALGMGKILVERNDADVQSFQILGLVYKALAEIKEADKLYKKALRKFPDEGILYNDFGDLLVDAQPEEAIKTWEKGIEVDPNYSGNYYYLSQQYAKKNDVMWSILYAEIFLNMESYSARTTEIKNLLLEQYKKFFKATNMAATITPQRVNDFIKKVAETLWQQNQVASLGITPESLTAIRTRFILDWDEKYAAKFPFRLFDHQRQLLKEGMFEAYNQWTFGPAANLTAYQLWQQYHAEELQNFLNFIGGKVFKIPSGQQYFK